MFELVLAGMATSAAATLLCAKLGWKAVLGYHALADIVFSAIFIAIFFGTYSGMVAGAIAGITFSATLAAGRYFFGYTKLEYVRGEGYVWRDYPPTFKTPKIVTAFRAGYTAWKEA